MLVAINCSITPYNNRDFSPFDTDGVRRERNLQRLNQYSRLDNPSIVSQKWAEISANEACDNEILYALECDAVHALVTEDRGIHAKARTLGLRDRVYTIQMAEGLVAATA